MIKLIAALGVVGMILAGSASAQAAESQEDSNVTVQTENVTASASAFRRGCRRVCENRCVRNRFGRRVCHKQCFTRC